MARPKRPSTLRSVLSTLASILEWLLFISEPVWTAVGDAWRRLASRLQAPAQSDQQGAAKKRAKRRSKAAASGTATGSKAGAAAGSKAGAAAGKSAAPAQWPTDSESSEEEEEGQAEPVAMPNEPAPAGWNPQEWEPAYPKQRAKRLAAPLAPTGGPRISTAAAKKSGAAKAPDRSKAPVAVCERPDCGGPVRRGFAKCAR